MKKLFISFNFKFLLAPILVLFFFLPNLLVSKIPIPADSLLGIYHPWRDNSYQNFNQYKFPVKNPLITDPILQTFPWKNLVIQNLKNFKLPLWNPYSFSGQPLLANVQSAPFQILNIFYFFLPFKIAWTIQIIFPVVLTSIFMFLFLKNKGLSDFSASFGAFVLSFSGFFVSWLTWGTVISTAMWLPLILLLIDKISFKLSLIYFLLLTFAFFQTLISGHIQTSIYVLFAATIYTIYISYQNKNIKFPIFIFLCSIIALLLASPQILPALEFADYSNRQLDQAYWPGRQDWFLPPQNLLQMIVPDFFGNPTTNNYWGIWNYAEFVSFVGLIPLYFAVNAIFNINRKTMIFIIIILLALLFGLENSISKTPYLLSIPLISSFQPSRIILLLVFGVSSLSAFGFESFFFKKFEKREIALALGFVFLLSITILFTIFKKNLFPQIQGIDAASVALRNSIFPFIISFGVLSLAILKKIKINQFLLIFIIFSLTILELFRFSYKFTPFTKISLIFPKTNIINYLSSQQKPFRVLSTDRRIASPNSLSFYNIETVSGYDPLYLKEYAILVNSWQSEKTESTASFNRIITPEKYQNPLTNLLNVKYILSFDEIQNSNFQKILEEGETKLYVNNNGLPRAFFPQNVLKVENNQAILSNLTNKNTDLKINAYSLDFENKTENLSATAQIVNYTDQNLLVKTVTNQEAPLLISNVFYPGWKAYLDKKEKPIKKIDYIFQSVEIPAGSHILELKYIPDSFYKGLYLSFLGVFSFFILSFLIWHKKFQL